MTQPLGTNRLRLEMTRRRMNGIELARAARVSPATVCAALAGKPVAPKTLKAIASALLRTPPVELIDSLIVGEGEQHEMGCHSCLLLREPRESTPRANAWRGRADPTAGWGPSIP